MQATPFCALHLSMAILSSPGSLTIQLRFHLKHASLDSKAKRQLEKKAAPF